MNSRNERSYGHRQRVHFPVEDLREKLNRKRAQQQGDEASNLETNKNLPPPDPQFNYLRDPSRDYERNSRPFNNRNKFRSNSFRGRGGHYFDNEYRDHQSLRRQNSRGLFREMSDFRSKSAGAPRSRSTEGMRSTKTSHNQDFERNYKSSNAERNLKFDRNMKDKGNKDLKTEKSERDNKDLGSGRNERDIRSDKIVREHRDTRTDSKSMFCNKIGNQSVALSKKEQFLKKKVKNSREKEENVNEKKENLTGPLLDIKVEFSSQTGERKCTLDEKELSMKIGVEVSENKNNEEKGIKSNNNKLNEDQNKTEIDKKNKYTRGDYKGRGRGYRRGFGRRGGRSFKEDKYESSGNNEEEIFVNDKREEEETYKINKKENKETVEVVHKDRESNDEKGQEVIDQKDQEIIDQKAEKTFDQEQENNETSHKDIEINETKTEENMEEVKKG